MNTEILKHVGERITIAHARKEGRPFFTDGILKDVSETHLYLITATGVQAFLLTELSKIEFRRGSV